MFDNKIKSYVYDRIASKFKDGTFTSGRNCIPVRYCYDGNISDYPMDRRTPEVCSYLMSYCRCKLSDVPASSRTRKFFLDSFTNKDVNNYIKNNITKFNRQFFKDLIATEKYSTSFETNCFEIMPVEYIDEEMCSLAILNSTNWSDYDWFMSVYKRKPEALTADLWKLAARLYSRMSGSENLILNITPNEYKDIEYYFEMCSCNYNCGMKLDTCKGKILESIPQEILTVEFLAELLLSDKDSVARFSEAALETEFSYSQDGELITENFWQLAVRTNGYSIENIKLNDERIEYFISHYDKDSSEYRFGFKDNYKKYMKEKNSPEALAKTQETIQDNITIIATLTLGNALLNANRGDDSNGSYEEFGIYVPSALPIKYRGVVPENYRKKYDSEEYLEMIYKSLGIIIIEEYDDLFYKVNLPEGWKIENEGYFNYVKDSEGNVIIGYMYDSKFYDRDAYVDTINVPEEEITEDTKMTLSKNDNKPKEK